MIWNVLQDPTLGCNSYIVGDEMSGTALVVDPLGVLGAETYIMAAQDLGLSIAYVAETHVHADHMSAAGELVAALGLKVSLSHRAPASFPFNPLHEGDTLTMGPVAVDVWETPGHTPDSISFVVRDTLRGSEPWLVMSGDSLFVGDVGRPDLVDATPDKVQAAALDQFRSVHRLMELPDFTELHPAHYGSSPCGGLFMSKKPASTIGYERRHNRMLQTANAMEFVDQQLKLLKPPPEEAAALRAQNLGYGVAVAR
ncbi:MAG: MBL fold metallo-hydrolase [Thermaerobacter sp.]|nr:MBL fold metallo-hydrolase [Thermaerobacter sp.]